MTFTFADVQNKTDIDPQFSDADKAAILAAMRTAYEGSPIARAMFDSWICDKRITINFLKDEFQAWPNTGKLEIDLNYLTQAMYIANNGTAVQDTAVTAIVHELVHALRGLSDNSKLVWSGATNDYRQPTVIASNEIYRELGLPEQNSYIAQNSFRNLTLNFQYTQGAAIDRSVATNGDWNSSGAGNSKDLLIGGVGNNTLRSGDGNDFLYGNGGNDTLDGGVGNDAYFFGAGEGADTVIDSDNLGTIRVAGISEALKGSREKSTLGQNRSSVWNDDNGIEYVKVNRPGNRGGHLV